MTSWRFPVRPQRYVQKAKELAGMIRSADARLDEIRMNQGVMLINLNRGRAYPRLQDYEFKVFSQWGEDGIIQRLIECVPIAHQTFIEFGVEDFFESNCRFLMMHNNWTGFVIDGSTENIERLLASRLPWRCHLHAHAAFITRENINELLAKSGFHSDLGLLSIDIDGMDYWIYEAIEGFRPRILICEYNSLFGAERKITVPYDPGFRRREKHFSNLYYGASLAAFAHLALERGYALVGTNSTGSNAFFVREDVRPPELPAFSAAEAFRPCMVRESMDESGRLTYLSGEERLAAIQGLPVVNVEDGLTEPL